MRVATITTEFQTRFFFPAVGSRRVQRPKLRGVVVSADGPFSLRLHPAVPYLCEKHNKAGRCELIQGIYTTYMRHRHARTMAMNGSISLWNLVFHLLVYTCRRIGHLQSTVLDFGGLHILTPKTIMCSPLENRFLNFNHEV